MYVFGHSASKKTLHQVASLLGLPLARSQQECFKALLCPDLSRLEEQVLVLGGGEDFERAALAKPRLLIEEGSLHMDFCLAPTLIEGEGVALSLTAKRASHPRMIEHVCRMLQSREFPCSDAEALKLVLQEAFANAIQHGILGLDPVERSSYESLSQLQSHLDKAFLDPELSERRILLTLQKEEEAALFSVRTQGEWKERFLEEKGYYQRGLFLIEKHTSFLMIDKKINQISFKI